VPEVSESLDKPLPPLLADAIAKAKAGLISPEEFLDLFEEHGVGGIQRMIHAHRAFNLGFDEIKRIEVERGRGLTEQQGEDIIDTIDHLQS
jgi:hypothetical protein